MPTDRFDQHHILVNLRDEPHRVENWRDGEHRDFIYLKNEIIVTPAGMESGWRWHAKSRVIVITLDPKAFQRFAESEAGVLLTERQLKDTPQFVDEDITTAAVLVMDALRQDGPGSEVMFESLARVLLVKLIQKYGDERSEEDLRFSRSFTARHYKDVLDHVAEHFGQAVTVEDMAARAGLSPFHFARLFKETVGQSPYQFVMAYRVEQAREMLQDQSRPIIDIALSCGFSDQAHLTRTFKKLTGQTPTAFRKAL